MSAADELLDRATEFTFYPTPDSDFKPLVDYYHFAYQVTWRGEGIWAVKNGPWCIGRRGTKSYESNPSSRTDRFKRAYRFSRDEAVAIALKYVDKQTVNGRTYQEWQRHWAADSERPS